MNIIEKWLLNLIHGMESVVHMKTLWGSRMSETFQIKVVLIGKGLKPCLLDILPPSRP